MARYINTLQDDLAAKTQELETVRKNIKDLEAYLTSSKFNCGDDLDGYVNVQDVLNRIRR